MTTAPSIPTEILARIIELTFSPRSLAAASLVSRQWNSALQTVICTLALKAHLTLWFLGPKLCDNQTSKTADTVPSVVFGVENTRVLPEFEKATLYTPSPRTVLVTMTTDVNVNGHELFALEPFEPAEAVRKIKNGIRARIPVIVPGAMNFYFSVATFQFMDSMGENVLRTKIASLEKALDLSRHLSIPHIQFNAASYILWSKSTPPFGGAILPAVREMTLVSTWAEEDLWRAIVPFTLQLLPFPNAKQLIAPHDEVRLSPSNLFRFRRTWLSSGTIAAILTPSVRERTATFITIAGDQAKYNVTRLFRNLEEFGTIPLCHGMFQLSDRHRDVIGSLPTSLHTILTTLDLFHLWFTSLSDLRDLFRQFSNSLPQATRRVIITITGAGPPRADISRATGRKLWRALVEITKRAVVEVSIDAPSEGTFNIDIVHESWKEQLGELVAAGELKGGTVILDTSGRGNGLP
ncbi:hypothetical protein M427DRAFT_35794 [Gonapodya prolifera JEL478]|uniref:F-box domain-containing protein n=1 Tax=Gonapodya prolifera (strain JEL478) TaxID=1344416 RepID=A0A139A3Q1_GONPJ|nr:hypothetical protein M427DRAFT_35794 [Gonapodya prolifera JEL478]|eukprot:KXS11411.1 hypothetical protein M427DRAFT_35794 [Gonapodya prolifera JEL478]